MLPETEFYVVNLLSYFANAEKFSQEYNDEPFAIMLKKARENEDERFVLSKRIGDLSGYMCGFFPERLQRKGINLNYYISMGKTGYDAASRLSAKRKYIFEEMSEKLPGIVDTLNEIRENREIMADKDIFDLYQRWLDSGSERLRKMLIEKGIVPLRETELIQ